MCMFEKDIIQFRALGKAKQFLEQRSDFSIPACIRHNSDSSVLNT